MYWSASSSIWLSISSPERVAGIVMILVITAEPATATAAFLVRLPERLTARRTASPTASTSVMFFSTTELGGNGSAA